MSVINGIHNISDGIVTLLDGYVYDMVVECLAKVNYSHDGYLTCFWSCVKRSCLHHQINNITIIITLMTSDDVKNLFLHIPSAMLQLSFIFNKLSWKLYQTHTIIQRSSKIYHVDIWRFYCVAVNINRGQYGPVLQRIPLCRRGGLHTRTNRLWMLPLCYWIGA